MSARTGFPPIKSGFTLIELLVVIALIAVLSTAGFASFQGIQSKARDGRRKNDLKAIGTALEGYYQFNNSYPSTDPNNCIHDPDPIYTQNSVSRYLAHQIVPKDPSTNINYCYISDSSGSYYKLYAKLENTTDPDSNIHCQGQNNYNYSVFSPDQTANCAPGDTRILNSTIATFQITSGGGDVNEDGTTYTPSVTSVWLGNRGTAAAWTGLRFTNVTIPKAAQINSAKLEVYSISSQWINMGFIIAAEDVGNSTAFSSSSQPSSRTLTSQTVNHSSNNQWDANTAYQLNEMASVIQAIVNRSDWVPGNSLSIILHGNGTAYGYKNVSSFEGGSANSVKLIITYSY